jgi:predicted AAA+ superfamily ATPase
MVHRKLFHDLKAHLEKKEYSIITGARQTGKSTILKQLEVYCKMKEIPVVFLNLENRALLSEMNENPHNLLKYLPVANKRTVALIDEIQYLKDPSNFLKLIYDEHSGFIKIVGSGSSAFYMDNQFRDSLAGRKKLFQLNTCSFDELLLLTEKPQLSEEFEKLKNNPSYRSTSIDYLRIEWENYMIYGGYPAIITEPDKNEKAERLKEIRDSFVKRDILEEGIINESAFFNLFRILAGQTGSLVNVNELSSLLRIKNDTVENYLSVLQKCFHIVLVKPFFRNLRKELIKMPKVFFLDTGLRNCLLNNLQPLSVRADKGELWENTVFRILADKYGTDAVHYWRTSAGNEVDFVLPDIDEPRAIEVKFDINQIRTTRYKIFRETYSDIPLKYLWFNPFHPGFFRSIDCLGMDII